MARKAEGQREPRPCLGTVGWAEQSSRQTCQPWPQESAAADRQREQQDAGLCGQQEEPVLSGRLVDPSSTPSPPPRAQPDTPGAGGGVPGVGSASPSGCTVKDRSWWRGAGVTEKQVCTSTSGWGPLCGATLRQTVSSRLSGRRIQRCQGEVAVRSPPALCIGTPTSLSPLDRRCSRHTWLGRSGIQPTVSQHGANLHTYLTRGQRHHLVDLQK